MGCDKGGCDKTRCPLVASPALLKAIIKRTLTPQPTDPDVKPEKKDLTEEEIRRIREALRQNGLNPCIDCALASPKNEPQDVPKDEPDKEPTSNTSP